MMITFTENVTAVKFWIMLVPGRGLSDSSVLSSMNIYVTLIFRRFATDMMNMQETSWLMTYLHA